VHLPRLSGVGRVASYVVFASLLTCAAARADISTVDGVAAPIVRIQLPTQANLTIRTWDRRQVQIDGDSTGFTVTKTAQFVPAVLPAQFIRAGQTNGPNGPIVLPAESFVVTTLTPGPHAVVLIKGEAGHPLGPITVTIPNGTQLVWANVGRGSLALQNYQNGTFILHLNNGTALVDGVSGDGFVQVLHGALFAADSNFDRLRARTAVGNQIYEHCNVKQIESSIVSGSIVYDDGHFDQGLARFDVTSGNVALGATSAAQLNAHVAGGHVTTLFDAHVAVDAHDTEATAMVQGGGPIVTATSGNGSVLLYDGTLRNKGRIPAEWQPARRVLRRENNVLPQGVPPADKQPNPPQQRPLNRPKGGRVVHFR
jgi:hypothetical protein